MKHSVDIVFLIAMLAACQPAPSPTSGAPQARPDCESTEVRVVDEEGQPLAGVEVWAEHSEVIHGSIPETSHYQHRTGAVARTGPDGWASVRDVALRNSRGFPTGGRYVAAKKGWPRAYGGAREPIVLGLPGTSG